MQDNLKSKIMSELAKNDGLLLSGGELAQKFDVSRNAVWKVMKELQKEGFVIESKHCGGYIFLSDGDVLNSQIIAQSLKTKRLGHTLEILKSIDSTNLYIKSKGFVEDGHVVVSEQQTKGQGRRGRAFHSPPGGIYMSVLIKPSIPPENVQFLTICTALAVSTAIKKVCGFEPDIKWINDIFYNGKKLCGISTQVSFLAEILGLEYAIIGIGINTGEISEEVADLAISTLQITGKRGYRNRLIAEVLNQLEEVLKDFLLNGKRNILTAYKKRLFILGQTVNVIEAMGDTFEAVVTDLTEDGELVVTDTQGNSCILNTSEVSIKAVNNDGHSKN